MTRYIDIPSIVLDCEVTSSTGIESWPFDNGQDEYWSGGSSPKNYRWRITVNIEQQTHSSPKTRRPLFFDGMDVKVGQYIANSQSGITLKIISIEEKTQNQVICVVEDILRYNTFRDPTGFANGIFGTPSSAVIFETNESGLPVLDPLPIEGIGRTFVGNVQSRFNNLEKDSNFVLYKENHGFNVGELISVDPDNDTFVLTDNAHPYIIGSVSYIDLGPHHFAINPIQKVLDNMDYLIGNVGDVLYADPTSAGGVSLSGFLPVMIKLREWTQTSITGNALGPTNSGNQFYLNGVLITVGGTGTTDDIVNSIDATISQHGVNAEKVNSPTSTETSLNLVYFQPALTAPDAGPYASITLNGELVTFTTNIAGKSEFGGAEFALEQDMAADINAANIPNIVASYTTNQLIITNTSGGPITIVNVTNDTNGNPFAGPNSGSGIPLNTPASTDSFVRLTAIDARAIDLLDVVGTPTADFGLYSVENGTKAAAIYIEKGLRSASVTVVTTIPARDALSAQIGDQAHVLDKGDGEWGLFLYDGIRWTLISSEETAKVDADTYTVELSHLSPNTGLIGEMNDGSKVSTVTVDVHTPFDGPATLTIGDASNNQRLMDINLNDLENVGSYTSTPTHVYQDGVDIDVNYYLDTAGSTMGNATVSISYS